MFAVVLVECVGPEGLVVGSDVGGKVEDDEEEEDDEENVEV